MRKWRTRYQSLYRKCSDRSICLYLHDLSDCAREQFTRFRCLKLLQIEPASWPSWIGSNVKTLYRMYDDKVEALEFYITENSKITGIPLRQMKLKKGLLISAIIRNDKLIIPDGQTEILPGDSMIVVTTMLGLQDAQNIMAE